MGIRINKYLSEAGYCSRRQADALIAAGEVLINGRKAVTGEQVEEDDEVVVKGERVRIDNAPKTVLAYNKPIGIECTSDPSVKDNIIKAVNYPKRLYTVGRLDKNSCGLILLTDDGELTNELTKASKGHEKEYYVRIYGTVTDEFVRKMSSGMKLDDKYAAPCKVSKIDDNSFTIVLTQGINRQIRRMTEACGERVKLLKRVRIGKLELGKLKVGEYRKLTADEIKLLQK